MTSEIEHQLVFGGLLRNLADAGYVVDSIKELTERFMPLPERAVQILLSSLRTFDEDGLKESVIWQLSAAEEPFDGRPLVACFEGSTTASLRWAILNTIAATRPHSISDWLGNALADTWIEKTLVERGRALNSSGLNDYLTTAREKLASQDSDNAKGRETDELGRYERVYGTMLHELFNAGFSVHSIEELEDRYAPLAEDAVEILLSSLQNLEDKDKPLILQTLQKAARPFDGRPLAECYDSTTDKMVRDNALLTIAVTKLRSIDNWLMGLDAETKKKLEALRYLA